MPVQYNPPTGGLPQLLPAGPGNSFGGKCPNKNQPLGTGHLDTYYIYNNAGMIAYVLPPLATNALAANSYNLAATPLSNMVYKFIYDTMGRLSQKTVPAKGVVSIVYNPQNEPVLTQDANMAGSKEWNYLKYDAKSRVIGSGIYTDNVHTTLTQMQNYVADTVSYTTWYETRSATASTTGYYTNVVFPTGLVTHTTTTPLSFAYYDNYIVIGTTPNFGYIHQGLTNEDSVTTAPLKGMPTVTTETTVGSGITAGEWLTTATFYDKRGNPIQTQSNNLLYYISFGNLTDLQTVVPDFTGVPQITKVSKQTASGTTATIQTNLTYDQSYRIKAVDQYYNGSTTVSHVAAYTYSEAGQVVKRSMAYNTATAAWLQNVDYRYNIRGQAMTINNSKLTADGGQTCDDANPVFGMDLFYNTYDSNLTTQAYYDGKLASAKWMAMNASNTRGNERAFVYSYDGINRYTGETYSERATTGTTAFTLTHGWDENSIKYDANGNIQGLRRDSSVQGTLANGTLIDQLKYTYNSSIPDQLYTVYDSSSSAKGFIGGATGSHYTYDANGNLTNEPYQGITGITYNVLNRTDSTKLSGTTYITYTYDAGGMLLRKKAYNSGTLTQTDYIGGFVYTGNGTTQTLAYAPMPEGRLLGAALTQEFVITDPQGNARVAFQNVSGVAKVTQENSYYGYGLLMPGSLVGWSAPPNKNLYNGGSEWQNDTKAINAGVPDYYQTYYRNYDPALARFVAVDPMAEGSESMGVYHYSGDNPIMSNDPDGNKSAALNAPDYILEDMSEQGAYQNMYQGSLYKEGSSGLFAGFWNTAISIGTQIISQMGTSGSSSMQFTGAEIESLVQQVEGLSSDQTLTLSITLPNATFSGQSSNGASVVSAQQSNSPNSNYLFSLRYSASVLAPQLRIVLGFNDPGDIASSFEWIQQVTKLLDDGNSSTFIDSYKDDSNNQPASPFYYSDYYLQERTNAEYPQNSGEYYSLRFGDTPLMQEDGTWQGWLSLVSLYPNGTIEDVVETVTYWFTSQNGQVIEHSPTFFTTPTPQLTQDAIDQYNQSLPPTFL
jgi:RHS repeat-associated protein